MASAAVVRYLMGAIERIAGQRELSGCLITLVSGSSFSWCLSRGKANCNRKSQAALTGLIWMVWDFLFCPIPTNDKFKPNSAVYGRNASHVVLQLVVAWRQTTASFSLALIYFLPSFKKRNNLSKIWCNAIYALHYVCFFFTTALCNAPLTFSV